MFSGFFGTFCKRELLEMLLPIFNNNQNILINVYMCLFKFLDKWSTSLLNTYIEHCLIVWKKENNQEKRSTIEKKIINILQSADFNTCDHYQVLILATSFDFKPAIVYIFEHNKQLSKKLKDYIFLIIIWQEKN